MSESATTESVGSESVVSEFGAKKVQRTHVPNEVFWPKLFKLYRVGVSGDGFEKQMNMKCTSIAARIKREAEKLIEATESPDIPAETKEEFKADIAELTKIYNTVTKTSVGGKRGRQALDASALSELLATARSMSEV